MPKLFQTEASAPKFNAQRNLIGRTHYVDDDTLRFHKSKILASYVVDNGLLFAIVESISLNYENSRRGFRYVVFNVFGEVIDRASLGDTWGSSVHATTAMWAYLNSINAKALTAEAARRAEKNFADDMARFRVEAGL